jgi:hypothetical protein
MAPTIFSKTFQAIAANLQSNTAKRIFYQCLLEEGVASPIEYLVQYFEASEEESKNEVKRLSRIPDISILEKVEKYFEDSRAIRNKRARVAYSIAIIFSVFCILFFLILILYVILIEQLTALFPIIPGLISGGLSGSLLYIYSKENNALKNIEHDLGMVYKAKVLFSLVRAYENQNEGLNKVVEGLITNYIK